MQDADKPEELYLPEKEALNHAALYKIRTFVAILAGCLAGVFGLTGLSGFILYGAISFALGLYLWFLSGLKMQNYFRSASDVLGTASVTTGVLSFILFWTIVYDSIYIF
eukprot:TRINITY_DN53744_c0_g1_i1.p1 TRINITY_DN53744_c0_g1~~TRINITY_DN53744_c0_g1_i1.p1  ORF type:complete len:125 (-),score=21.88 TRINITY_DN53744_c0_g1_i1:140-466(-)